MILTLEEIAELIDAKVYGKSSKEIIGMNTLDNATSDQISHAVSQKYQKSLISSNAGAVIVDKKLIEHCSSNALL